MIPRTEYPCWVWMNGVFIQSQPAPAHVQAVECRAIPLDRYNELLEFEQRILTLREEYQKLLGIPGMTKP